MIVSQNGVDSVQVSWTAPSGEPTVTGYIIYYHQQDGGHTGSEIAGDTATTATITGLMTGAKYSITMVATSSTLPSNVTAAVTITIGIYDVIILGNMRYYLYTYQVLVIQYYYVSLVIIGKCKCMDSN